MAKYNVTPPDLNESKTYEAYKREVNAWDAVTDLGAAKRGNIVALSLPNKSKFGNDIRERVFESLSQDTLKAENGLKKLLEFLDTELGKDAISDVIEKWDDFDSCKKSEAQSLEDFIAEFESKSNRVKSAGTTLPEEILAYMLMKRAGLSNLERMLVLSRVDMTKKDTLYKEVKLHMTNILGKCLKSGANSSASVDSIKLEPAYLAQHEDILAAAGYYKNNGHNSKPYKGGFKGKPKYKNQKQDQGSWKPQTQNKGSRPVNPKGSDGKTLTCRACGSFRHMVKECQHSYENNAFVVEEEGDEGSVCMAEGLIQDDYPEIERFVLFTSDREEINRFTSEAINSAALDTCCTSTVAGEKWMKIYLSSLPNYLKHKVVGPTKSDRCFKFGNQGILSSKGKYKIPTVIAGIEQMLDVDVISSDIPMLLSKKDMKDRNMVLYMLEDKAEILGKAIDLKTTSAGHYLLPLLSDVQTEPEMVAVAELQAIDLVNAEGKDKMAALAKLHKQFGHRPKQSFINLLKSAESWSEDMSKMLDLIIEGCEGCIKRRRNPDKPVVAMSMASEFNQKVAIDLKIWKGKYILYMIDMWSRLTKAVEIGRKKPGEVINAIMQYWVANFEVMGSILNDNGGEFTGEEIREVKSILNVRDITTGAESPWQNGLCERNHALADNILDRIHEDYPDNDLNTKLAWACMAKNSLQMVYGYSPNQLVFGKNPKLPNIITDGPPAWEQSTMSEKLATHLNTLHSARKAFIQSESCHKLKLALKNKIRLNEAVFENGDVVYYKRERDEKWLGPGNVVFQDGKVIFVRHGAHFVRVSTSRIIKAGEELAKKCNPESTVRDSLSDSNKDHIQHESSKKGSGQLLEMMDSIKDPTLQSSTKDSDHVQEINLQNSNKDSVTMSSTKDSAHSENFQKDSTKDPIVKDSTKDLPETVIAKKSIFLKKHDEIRYKEGGEWKDATILSRASKATGKYKNWYNVRLHDGNDDQSIDLESVEFLKVDATADMSSEDALLTTIPKEEQGSPECLKAKLVELEKLESFDVYKIVRDEGQERISSTWVLTNKNGEARARLVARGFEETEEIAKDSPTMCKSSFRTILCLAVSNKWTIETTDIKSAFLQGAPLEREVFVKPPREANLQKGHLWQLQKCLYGLIDASRQWYFEVKSTLIDLGCTQSKMDLAVFFKLDSAGKLIGVVGVHVDDFIHCGTQMFNKMIIEPLVQKFQVGKNEKVQFMYTGFQVIQKQNYIILDQNHYTQSSVEVLPVSPERSKEKKAALNEEETSQLRKMTGSLNWVVRATRPDLSFEMIELSTRFQKGCIEDLLRARKALINLKKHKAQILIPDVGPASSWNLVVYTDASLGNLNDGVDSTGGYIVFLTNKEKRVAAAIDWSANKIKRVVRSTLAAEALSLCEGLEAAIHHREILEEIVNLEPKSIKIHAIIDNKSTVQAVYSTTVVDDKRLRREIGGIREMLACGTVDSLEWVKGSDQLADVLTKRGVDGSPLLEVLQNGCFY